MIVLDEQIHGPRIQGPIARWYPGQVLSITDLRSRSTIPDEAIPTLLLSVAAPTFVTINVTDFWRKRIVHPRYAVVCLELSNERAFETPHWLRRYLALSVFKTKTARMGTMALLRPSRIEYYRGQSDVITIPWQD